MSSKLPLTELGESEYAASPALSGGHRAYEPPRDQLSRRQLKEKTAHRHSPGHLGNSRRPVIGQVQEDPAARLSQQVRPAGLFGGAIWIRKRWDLECWGQGSANSCLRDSEAMPIHSDTISLGPTQRSWRWFLHHQLRRIGPKPDIPGRAKIRTPT